LILEGPSTFTSGFTNNGGAVWINDSAGLGAGNKTIYLSSDKMGAGLHLNGTNGDLSLASGLTFI
jgi:hypothetical protein